jgi:hypothetical protein
MHGERQHPREDDAVTTPPTVFIAHCHDDASQAVVEHVRRAVGSAAAVETMPPGQEARGQPIPLPAREAIDACDIFVAVLTDDPMESDWVALETSLAIARGEPIVPLKAKGVEQRGALPRLNWIAFDPRDPAPAVREVAGALRENLAPLNR